LASVAEDLLRRTRDAIAYHQQRLADHRPGQPPALQDDFLQVAQGNTVSDLAELA
jgi:hypothetical protein